MDIFTKTELNDAVRAVTSMINKSEKAIQKLTAGSWQYTMTQQSLNANYIAIAFLNRELGTNDSEILCKSSPADEELTNALATIASIIDRIEKVQPKFKVGTPQSTLAVRRIRALHISAELIKRGLGKR